MYVVSVHRLARYDEMSGRNVQDHAFASFEYRSKAEAERKANEVLRSWRAHPGYEVNEAGSVYDKAHGGLLVMMVRVSVQGFAWEANGARNEKAA